MCSGKVALNIQMSSICAIGKCWYSIEHIRSAILARCRAIGHSEGHDLVMVQAPMGPKGCLVLVALAQENLVEAFRQIDCCQIFLTINSL